MNNSQKKKQSVFTFTNWLIASIIIAIIAIISLTNLLENPQNRQIRQAADKNLRLFARGNSLKAINCHWVDKKGDGWVDCRATDRQGQMVFLECPYDANQQECRYKINQ